MSAESLFCLGKDSRRTKTSRRAGLILFLATLAALSASLPAQGDVGGSASTAGTATATIVTAPPPASASRDASFTFESTDGGVSFQCALDGPVFLPCSSPQTYFSLADGTHAFAVEAVDGAGNAGSPNTYSWTVDTVAPTVQLTSTPAAVSSERFAEFTLQSNEPNSSFSCSLDGAAGSLCVSPQSYSNLSLGTHTFTVTATDPAGNTSNPVTYAWSIVPPPPPANVGGLRVRVRYRMVELSWTLPRDRNFDHLLVLRSDGFAGNRVRVYNGTGTSFQDTHVNNGRLYRYVLVSYDAAGNGSSGVSVSVSPDSLLRPRDGGRMSGSSRLAWAAVPRAIFYNVQLYRNGSKILSAWPTTTGLRLHRRWRYGGHTHSLLPGQYSWYVWPAFSRRQYGPLLGQSSFTVSQ